ncbi:unnamed protein product, partial [Cuscuta campestris]
MGSNVLFIFLLFLGVFCLQSACKSKEHNALMELKDGLDPGGQLLSSWNIDGITCSFEGVGCNEEKKVINISLPTKGLTGRLLPVVANLTSLSGLYLHYNNLSGEIPSEIGKLSRLTDLYLNVNNFSGSIPQEIGNISSLKVLEISYNQLTGGIPEEIGALKKLEILALEYNKLVGFIPPSLGSLKLLKSVFLGFNRLSGQIPTTLARAPNLEFLDVQNNTLAGAIPPDLKRLNESFRGANNSGLCGNGFSLVRVCTSWDAGIINIVDPPLASEPHNETAPVSAPEHPDIPLPCDPGHCPTSSSLSSSSPSKTRQFGIIIGVISLVVTLLVAMAVAMFLYRWHSQKEENTSKPYDDPHVNESVRYPSTRMNLEHSDQLDVMSPDYCTLDDDDRLLGGFKYNLEEIESATQHFSYNNLLGKSKFSAVYKGIIKDGSTVAIKSINATACKSDESEFMKGLNLLMSLKQDNLVELRGFCCSRARGEYFLVYSFASKGNLALYLDLEEGDERILNWPRRVSIIKGIAKGLGYLHDSEGNKSSIVHQNISVEKILLDELFNPLISDSGLLKLFAEDVVYSALKVSAALGYMAPEYITTGRFTEKSDVYAFGVIILQVLSGKCILMSSARQVAESRNFAALIDPNLKGSFFESEAAKLIKVALDCTTEIPGERPSMAAV